MQGLFGGQEQNGLTYLFNNSKQHWGGFFFVCAVLYEMNEETENTLKVWHDLFLSWINTAANRDEIFGGEKNQTKNLVFWQQLEI